MMASEPGVRAKDDPRPLAIGTVLNLQREMPQGDRAWRDKGWRVIGYSNKANGKWIGYVLEHERIVPTSCSKFEAVEIVQLPETTTP